MDTLTFPIDAVTDIPDDLVAAVVTYLEMTAPPPREPGADRAGLRFERMHGRDVARYRALYRAVGERWLWFSRLSLEEAALAAILDDPGVVALAVVGEGRDLGLVELDGRAEGETELAFFGLVNAGIGRGLGRAMMAEAVERAFARRIRRLFVHTCTLDHPGAVGFYQRAGFRPYKRAVEIARDPRALGLIKSEADSHIPALTMTAEGAGKHSQSVVDRGISGA